MKILKPSLALAAVAVLSACSTSKISIQKDAVKQIKTIAVMPFKSKIADAKATRESTEAFKGALINSGFQVVEREKLNKLLKEKELAQTGLVDNKAIEAGQFLGAEAVLLGEITAHEMSSQMTEAELPADGPGKYDSKLDKGDGTFFQRDQKWFKKDKRDTFQFQIVVRLISNVDAQTALTLQNEYPVRVYSSAQGNLSPANLDQYRNQVLTQMGKDLEKAIKEARE